jgi:oligopeptide transport system ATP-binding protein
MTEPVLKIDDLHVRFPLGRSLMDLLQGRPGRVVSALNGVTLDLFRGETLGVVGESGCGKSTLARALVRLNTPSSGTVLHEDPHSSLNPRMTCGQILAEALTVHRMCSPDRVPARITELLDLVRLPQDAAGKLPHQFSGGQRQRIAIARALSVEPEILVADELVSALDVSVQAQVVNLLLDLQERLGLTILFVAHDLRLVRHVSNRVAVIYLGRIVEIGDSETVFRAPVHPYSQALLSAAPSLDPDERGTAKRLQGELPSPLNIPPGCPFHLRCSLATERCKQERPALRPVAGRGEVACHLSEEIANAN